MTGDGMKDKIYRNRQVLRGTSFKAKLLSKEQDFTIMYVTDKAVNISKSISYDEMSHASPGSLQSIVKRIILENSVGDADSSLSQRAFGSRTKLKRISLPIGGYEFHFSYIFKSSVKLDLDIGLDDLMESEENTFIGDVKNVVMDNILDNPPKIEKIGADINSREAPFIVGSKINTMDFKTVGPQRKFVSDAEVERNREIYKEQREKEKLNRERARKLNEELNLDKKTYTRHLARHR